MILILLAVLTFLVLMNLVTFLAFGADKAHAVAGRQRIPERHLLALAVLGGWIGAKLAQRRFRHKTRKQPFARILNSIPVMWCGLLAFMIFFASSPTLAEWNFSFNNAQTEMQHRPTPKFFQRVGD